MHFFTDRRPFPVLALVLTTLLLATPAVAKDLGTKYDKNADFSTYKTFKWDQESQKPRGPRVSPGGDVDLMIREHATAALQASGLTASEEEADLLVGYDAAAIEVMNVESVTNYEARRQQPMGGIDWVMDGTMSSYVDGTLVITLTDAKTGKTVWTGWTTEKIKNVSNPHKQVRKMVRKLLGRFPPKK